MDLDRQAIRDQGDPSASLGEYARLCRPKQWVKNLLVAAAPFAAGVMNDLATIATVVAGVVAFSLVASAMYGLNDVRDAVADRTHPVKRNRPVAAGTITPAAATAFSGVLLTAGLLLAVATGSVVFAAVLVLYAGLTAAYSVWLKHVALIDIAMVAVGFLLRALSGAVLVDVPISAWFLIVTTFGALFIAAGKRFAERTRLVNGGRDHRAALEDYAPGFLEFLLGVSAAVVLLSYSLWAFAIDNGAAGIPWGAISLGPFVLGVLRYAQLVYLGRGGEPETLVLADRGLQVIGVVWLIIVALTFYGGGA